MTPSSAAAFTRVRHSKTILASHNQELEHEMKPYWAGSSSLRHTSDPFVTASSTSTSLTKDELSVASVLASLSPNVGTADVRSSAAVAPVWTPNSGTGSSTYRSRSSATNTSQAPMTQTVTPDLDNQYGSQQRRRLSPHQHHRVQEELAEQNQSLLYCRPIDTLSSSYAARRSPHCRQGAYSEEMMQLENQGMKHRQLLGNYKETSLNSVLSPYATRHQEEGAPFKPPLVVASNTFTSDNNSTVGSRRMEGQDWFHGSISLALPDDEDVLSPLHCFMRRHCVEAFSATPDDVATPRYGKSHGIKVVVGQVGIRCLFCKHRPVGERPERAVCYPSSLRNIYHSIETWQRRHSLVCQDIEPWVSKTMVHLMESSKTRAGGRRQYWEDSAIRLGMVNTIEHRHGVRFARPPGDLGEPLLPALQQREQDFLVRQSEATSACSVVRTDDQSLVTEYLFLLMNQMQTCRFTEEDRVGGRSKIKDNDIGFPGMQCKHCLGKAGFGRYFPMSVTSLALANSDRNINNHLQKCRRCPEDIKEELRRLVSTKSQSQSKNRRGLRKLFFQKVWTRMHGSNQTETKGELREP